MKMPALSQIAKQYLMVLLLCSLTLACGESETRSEGQWLAYVSLVAKKDPYAPPNEPSDPLGSLGTLRAVKLVQGGLEAPRALDEELVIGATLQFSPDGQWLAYQATTPKEGNRLKVVSLGGSVPGTPRTIASEQDPESSFSWAPDGSALAYLQPASNAPFSHVVLVSSSTWKPDILVRGSSSEAVALSWFEDPLSFHKEACDALLKKTEIPLDPFVSCGAAMASEDARWAALGGRRLVHLDDEGRGHTFDVQAPESMALEPVAFTHDSTGLIMKYQPFGDWFEHYLIDLTEPSLSRIVEIGWVKPQSAEPLALTDTHFALAAGVFVEVGELARPDMRQRVVHENNGYEWAAFLRWQPRP